MSEFERILYDASHHEMMLIARYLDAAFDDDTPQEIYDQLELDMRVLKRKYRLDSDD